MIYFNKRFVEIYAAHQLIAFHPLTKRLMT